MPLWQSLSDVTFSMSAPASLSCECKSSRLALGDRAIQWCGSFGCALLMPDSCESWGSRSSLSPAATPPAPAVLPVIVETHPMPVPTFRSFDAQHLPLFDERHAERVVAQGGEPWTRSPSDDIN